MIYNLLESTSCQHICLPAALVIKGISPVHSVGRSGRMQKGGLDLSLILHERPRGNFPNFLQDFETVSVRLGIARPSPCPSLTAAEHGQSL